MAMIGNVAQRIAKIANSPSVTVIPVGEASVAERRIVRAYGDRLGAAIRAALGAMAVAAVLGAPLAHAQGAGWDANVYGQAQGQVMQQGSAIPMRVVDVRAVKIELPAQQQSGASQIGGYAVTAGGAAMGAIVGNQIGHNQAVKNVGGIVGGLLGAVAGNAVNGMVNAPPQARQIDGVALTLVNPANNQMSSITQAGTQAFSPGDRVLVINSGGTSRVVPDRSNAQEQGYSNNPAPGYMQQDQGQNFGGQRGVMNSGGKGMVFSVIKAGNTMGLRLDPDKVANMLKTGMTERYGMHIGRVVGVDMERGLVYQDAGRGQGVVYLANMLNRVPAVGEVVTVTLRDGIGNVSGRDQGQSRARG